MLNPQRFCCSPIAGSSCCCIGRLVLAEVASPVDLHGVHPMPSIWVIPNNIEIVSNWVKLRVCGVPKLPDLIQKIPLLSVKELLLEA
jgi:hypothetical protein